MNDIFTTLSAARGYVSRHELIDCGFTDSHIGQALRAKVIVRIRHGTYVPAAIWNEMTAVGRHRILTHSVADRLGDAVAISHSSAAAEYGCDLFDADLSTVHVTRLDHGSGRSEAGVVHHSGLVLADDELEVIDGRLYVKAARAVAETCLISSIESGMVVASSALRTEVVNESQLRDLAERFDRWRGVRHARLACQLADGRLESVGEVRSFHMAWKWGLPAPTLQYEVRDRTGRLLGRTDFAWLEHRHVGEFDGLVKYGRLNPDSRDPGATITDEKIREDLIRGEYLGMSRWTWRDVDPIRQRKTVQRIKADLDQSKRLYFRNAVTIPLS